MWIKDIFLCLTIVRIITMDKFARIVCMLMAVIMPLLCLPTGAHIGFNYGTLGDDLPRPTEVFALCKKHNITRIRIFEPYPSILQALGKYRNISVIVGTRNQDVEAIAKDYSVAKAWVRKNILTYKNVKFRYISLGNEISPLDSASASIAPYVGPAMVNVYKVIRDKVKVSTVLSAAVLGGSYPPSAGAFKSNISEFINPIIKFLEETRAPLLANIYPYFAYAGDSNIALDFAVFKSTTPVVTDGEYQYKNLFSAMVDAFRAAVLKAGGENVKFVVTETGWPSAGGKDTTIGNDGNSYIVV